MVNSLHGGLRGKKWRGLTQFLVGLKNNLPMKKLFTANISSCQEMSCRSLFLHNAAGLL